jgi:homoserine dehydrogenase
VVADLIDIARGSVRPVFGIPADKLAVLPNLPMGEHLCPYYLRLLVLDRPGVVADIAAALRDENISMESMIQRGRAEGEAEAVPIVIMTHETQEAQIQRALARIGELEAVVEQPRLIRIVDL